VILRQQCPARVHLFLEVTGRRADGLPTLRSLSGKIALFDELEIEPHPSFELEVVSEPAEAVPEGRENSVLRAAEAFRRALRTGAGARIRLLKRIPRRAGLGGADSDAAGTLLGLARLCRLERKPGVRARLRELALGLGPGVLQFLSRFPFHEVRGLGERLSRAEVGRTLPALILVHPGGGGRPGGNAADWKGPGRAAALTSLSQLGKLKKKLEKGKSISGWGGLVFNRLEEGVLARRPEVAQAKAMLVRLGLRGVAVSGPGPCVFGFVPSPAEGEIAYRRLKAYPWKAFSTCFLG
jgi:4-diphosphocytidyl-2-C-methyl-D-erythritol kinase